MKYGVITYVRNKDVNLGDNMMSLGIRNIYKKMGIKDEDIVNIYFNQGVEKDYDDKYDLIGYDGDEYILLPMTMFMDFDAYRQDIFPLSPKIIPVFIGFHCISPDGFICSLEKYRHIGPFGCRDVMTMRSMRKAGLDAYTLGCLSIQSVERREETEEQNKVFLVNVPQKVKDIMPKELLENAVEIAQTMDFDDAIKGTEAAELDLNLTKQYLEKYRKYAKLVITSKLHCALPCISMGIPTIVVKWGERGKWENVSVLDHRFEGLDKFMNIYACDELDKIDWNPPKPDIEEFKAKQLRQAIKMINNVYEKYNELTEISTFIESNPKSNYFSAVSVGYLSRKQKEDFYAGKTKYKTTLELIMDKYLYDTHLIVYGAGDKGKWMYTKFKNEMNMAKSCIYVDGNEEKQGKKIWGINILSPKVIEKYPKDKYAIIIATNHSYDKISQDIAKSLKEDYSLIEGKDYFMLDKIIKSDELPLSGISMIRPAREDIIWG